MGNPVTMNDDLVGQTGGNLPFKYATELKFPRFQEEGVEERLFKVEQFFLLDKTIEQARISVVALHLEGNTLHLHKNYIKLKGRIPSWGEYVTTMSVALEPEVRGHNSHFIY